MRLPLPLALLVIATPACAQSLDKWVEPKVYSPGLIAGIVIASLAALGVAIALMFGFIWCNRRRHNMLHPNRLIQALSRNSNKHDTGSSSGDSSLVEKGKGGMPTMASTAPIVVNYPVEPEKAHGGGPRGATGGLWGENLHSSGSSGQFVSAGRCLAWISMLTGAAYATADQLWWQENGDKGQARATDLLRWSSDVCGSRQVAKLGG